ncbi:DUF222 domain-containing protein [Microbacterium sp. NPDC096154]|uniref:HNH endonuclease signature motif containing protein n=1 Tax=Microbacterium sp. NPDC096154 TaxID=3155549 RepID=UPI00331EC122
MTRFMDADDLGWGFTPAERIRTRTAIERLRSVRRERARLDAEEARVLAEVTDIALGQLARDPNASVHRFPLRSMATELALALRESPRAMQRRMERAHDLVTRFPAAHAALAQGRVTARHTQEIVAVGADLREDAARAAYEAEITAMAERSTPGRTRALAARVAEKHQPTTLVERHEIARSERRVWVADLPDGMAELGMVAPAVVVHAVFDRLTALARAVHRDRPAAAMRADGSAGGPHDNHAADNHAADNHAADLHAADLRDDRRLAQLRADLAADLLVSGAPSGHDVERSIAATVEITIPATTLSGLDDGLALLAGSGPLDAATARRLAGHAIGWERLFVNPDTGALLTVDRYTPTAAQRRYLLARDRTCRVPGCVTKAKHSDIDHTVPYSRGGPTEIGNLAALCEAHHTLKHHSPWRVRQLGGGRLLWHSPAGYDYLDIPPVLIDTGTPSAPF